MIIEKNEAVPAKGGNIVVYNEIAGSDKTVMCEEYTMCKYEGSSANEFIALPQNPKTPKNEHIN